MSEKFQNTSSTDSVCEIYDFLLLTRICHVNESFFRGQSINSVRLMLRYIPASFSFNESDSRGKLCKSST